MTVPAQTTLYNESIANGVTTSFPYQFKIATADDITVELDGVVTTTGFTVSGVGQDSGGSIDFVTAPANGVTVLRYLDPVFSRETNYQQFGDWLSPTVNLEFDRLWLAMQSLFAKMRRAIKLPVATADDQMIIEDDADRAGKVLAFGANGKITLITAHTGTSLVDISASSGSSLVGYIQSFIGSVVRSVQDRLRDTVSVKDFGAVGDAVTDDIAAFVLAANSGKQVMVPDGEYVLTVANQTQLTAIFGMLNRLHIFAKKVTISIAAGAFTESARTELKVTNGDRLKINGADPTTLTFSSLGSITSNGSGDHDVTFNFTDASSVSVGSYIICRGLSGVKYGPLEGVWKCTAKVGNAVTVKVTAKPALLSGISVGSGTFKKMNTVITYSNSMGIYVNSIMGADSGVSCGLSNMVIAGDGSYNSGVFIEYDCTLTVGGEFGVHGFGRFGYYGLYASTLSAQNACASANGETGFYGLAGATMQVVGGVSTGNGSYGFVASADSSIAGSTSNASGNVTGYYITGGSTCVNNSALAQYNTTYGIYCDENSYVDATNGVATYNGTGVLVSDASFCIFTGGTATNNTTVDAKENDVLSKISGGTFGTTSLNSYPARILQASLTYNFGAIGANAQLTTTLTVTGVATSKCNAVVNSNGAHVDGLVLTCHPSATDTITIIASNIKGTGITVGNRTYYVTVFMHP